MKSKPVDWLSIAQFSLSLLAVLGAWALAIGAVLISLLGSGAEFALPTAGLAIGAVGFSLLLLPSTILALMRLMGSNLAERIRPTARIRWWLVILLLGLALAAALLLGYLMVGSPVDWLVFPVLHFLAVGLPIVILVYLGMRGLPAASRQRRWGLFDSGLTLSPLLIIIAEIAAFVGFAALGMLLIVTRPELMETLRELASQVTTPEVTPEKITELFGPLFLRPGFILAAFLFVSVVVPMIEEALKPVGMWFLHGRLRRPAAGFVAGLLCGGGYAMFESLVAFNGAEQWTSISIARMGTAAVHVVLSGLVGWALVRAWREKRYLGLGGTYLAAVAIHGSWNAMTVILLVNGIAASQPEPVDMPVIAALAVAAPFILGLLTLLCLGLLIGMNRKLRREGNTGTAPEAASQTEVANNVL
jgi:hypothetical protein